MDIDKILEKIIKWLADPRGRKMLRTLIFLVFPLFVLFMLRSAARRRTTEKTSSAIQPKIRPVTTESLTRTESVRETMARHQKKMSRELQEVFGREERLLTKTSRKELVPDADKASRPSEHPESSQKTMLQEELLKLFSRRPN